jgi:hypothetical protein
MINALRSIGLGAAFFFLAPTAAMAEQVPNPANMPSSVTTGHVPTMTSGSQQLQDGGAGIAGVSVRNPGTGNLERLLPMQTITGTSHSFIPGDLFEKTRRSNAGSAMTDTLPTSSATGMTNGTEIHITNVDASASDTITAGSGTTISGSSTFVLTAGRDLWLTYDGAGTWRPAGNSGTAVLAPNNLSELANAATARTNLGLGTAATYGVGTSGGVLGLLNGNNTYSGTDIFTGPLTIGSASAINPQTVSIVGSVAEYNLGNVYGVQILGSVGGTAAAPTSVTNGQALGQLQFKGYDGSGYDVAGALICYTGPPSTGVLPGACGLFTASSSGVLTKGLYQDNTQTVYVGSSSYKIADSTGHLFAQYVQTLGSTICTQVTGEGCMYGTSTGGGTVTGQGSTCDVTIANNAGAAALCVLTGSQNLSAPGSTLKFTNSTSVNIDFGPSGLALPTLTAIPSVGTRLRFYDGSSSTALDWGYGIAPGALWSSVGQWGNAWYWMSPNAAGTAVVTQMTVQNGNLSTLGVIQPAGYTVATLPTCNTSAKGSRAWVSDASGPTPGGALTGGGVSFSPATCNGSTWIDA